MGLNPNNTVAMIEYNKIAFGLEQVGEMQKLMSMNSREYCKGKQHADNLANLDSYRETRIITACVLVSKLPIT